MLESEESLQNVVPPDQTDPDMLFVVWVGCWAEEVLSCCASTCVSVSGMCWRLIATQFMPCNPCSLSNYWLLLSLPCQRLSSGARATSLHALHTLETLLEYVLTILHAGKHVWTGAWNQKSTVMFLLAHLCNQAKATVHSLHRTLDSKGEC